MAGVGEEEVEYESDPEEAKMSLKMRRREASDDEDEGGGRDGVGIERREKAVWGMDSEGESDGEGAPAEYEEEEIEEEEEEYYLQEEEELEEEREYDEEEEGEDSGEGRHGRDVDDVMVAEGEGDKEGGGGKRSAEVDGRGINGLNETSDGNNINNQRQREEEKKENEPYAVPTAGAFYMHDDRFRDNASGRNRRTLGGRKLWESKDDRKWGHDKFEELTMHERQYEEGRKPSRGRYQGRGRGRAALHGYSRGNRPKTYGNTSNQHNNNNQNNAPKIVRGRGPRKYQPSFKNNNDVPPAKNKLSGKSFEKSSPASSGRTTVPALDGGSGTVPARKQVFASSLNYASPPFYPSTSSNKEIMRDVQSRTMSRNVQPPVSDENFLMAQSSRMLRGKNIVDSLVMDKLYIDNSTSGVAGKPSTTLQFPPSGSSSRNSSQSQQLKAQGRGVNSLPLMAYQPTAATKLVNRVSRSTQLHAIQQNSIQSRVQPSVQASGMQFAQRPGSLSPPSSPPKAAVPVNSLESGELESHSESSKSKNALVGKGKVNVQGSGRGSFLYGGAQVTRPLGNMGTGHSDQNIPGAPAFYPVMQFGAQHPGGIGVPAVGMAFPGYVGQPQLGLGNSEMTWLPVLAGTAGALGATYPYIALDGAYHPRPSGQTSLTGASSKENNIKPGTESKSSQRPELANDDFGQRQKNPRRYTEMKFDK